LENAIKIEECEMRVFYVFFSAVLFLAGCKTIDPIYYYGAYPEAMYSYFKADTTSISQQILMLEQVIEQAQGKGKPVAPGVHAHLGMLYFESGNADQGVTHFEREKALFPESTAYLDFLMKQAVGAKI
jgi:hypothetical protein